MLFRTTITKNDPYRNWTLLWDRGNINDPDQVGLFRRGDKAYKMSYVHRTTGAPGAFTLDATTDLLDKTPRFRIRQFEEFEWWHWRTMAALPTTELGSYNILAEGRQRPEIITVVASPLATRAKRSINSLEYITYWGNQYDLTLTPNEYTLGTRVLPQYGVLRGYGATVTNGTLIVAGGCTIVGLTFVDCTIQGQFDNVVFVDCTFLRCQVGPMTLVDRQALFQDCTFKNSGCYNLGSGLFLRCLWDGPSWNLVKVAHAFSTEYAVRLAMIDCEFRGTDRGLVLRTHHGPSDNNLYAGLQFTDINKTPNGSELFCIEGPAPGFNNNLVFCLRQTGCVGEFLLYNAPASNNLLQNVRVPISIAGLDQPQLRNYIFDSECPFIRVNWPGGRQAADGTLIRDTGSIGFRPSAANQAAGSPAYYTADKWPAVIYDARTTPTPTTVGERITVKDFASGFFATKGVRLV